MLLGSMFSVGFFAVCVRLRVVGAVSLESGVERVGDVAESDRSSAAASLGGTACERDNAGDLVKRFFNVSGDVVSSERGVCVTPAGGSSLGRGN